MPDEPLENPEDFALLEGYLEDLHAGRNPDRAQLLVAHPELARMLDCLESLDRLAPAVRPPIDCQAPTLTQLPGGTSSEHLVNSRYPPPTTSFGAYELLGELGRGGMGVVYKARQKELDRVVAIKMILSSNLATPEHVRRFHAEARAAARLQHPNIVQIHEAGELDGQHYFVMEHIEGPSLADVLDRQRPPPDDGARLLAIVARAADYLHRQGFIHRDLKPSNVLLQRPDSETRRPGDQEHKSGELLSVSPCLPFSWAPKLTDFGLVKMLGSSSDMTRTGAIVGTPSYMSPEQAAGRHRQVGPPSDIFSLGAILYQVLTGRPPFVTSTPLETLVQAIEAEPVPPRRINPGAPRELELICLKCLEKSPEKRYGSAGALAEDLERYLRGEGINARPHGLGQRLWRWARREPALAAHLIALGLFAILIHTVYLVAEHVSLALHGSVLGLLAAWAVASFLYQTGLGSERWGKRCRQAWIATDAIMLTLVLALSDNATNPLVVFYALLIVGSGLWFHVSLVWFATFVCELCYALLMAWAATAGIEIIYPHHQIIFMLSLAVTGYMVAYQVRRVRALSHFYENRPLP
jgi:serine/threonine-protein kinase